MNKVLDVQNLHVSFDTYAGEVKAVRGVTFSLSEGEVLAIRAVSPAAARASRRRPS